MRPAVELPQALLLLLAQPDWSNKGPSAIKQRLQSTARADAFTGAVPNATWGHGKLNAEAALAPLATLQIVFACADAAGKANSRAAEIMRFMKASSGCHHAEA